MRLQKNQKPSNSHAWNSITQTSGIIRKQDFTSPFIRPHEVLAMEPSLITALSVVLGALVGGTSSIATALFTQRAQSRRESVKVEIQRRELVYTEFINECSKLLNDALERSLESPAAFVQVYALLNRIRLTSSDAVVAAAEQLIKNIIDQYFQPKVPIEELRKMAAPGSGADPIQQFSEICRHELHQLLRSV